MSSEHARARAAPPSWPGVTPPAVRCCSRSLVEDRRNEVARRHRRANMDAHRGLLVSAATDHPVGEGDLDVRAGAGFPQEPPQPLDDGHGALLHSEDSCAEHQEPGERERHRHEEKLQRLTGHVAPSGSLALLNRRARTGFAPLWQHRCTFQAKFERVARIAQVTCGGPMGR